MHVFKTLEDKELTAALSAGGVGIVPTDTIYGLAARAADESAAAKLYELKNREDKPGTIIAASIDQLVELGLKRAYLKPVEHYWPNPISIIIPTFGLEYLHRGKRGLAVRIPNDDALLNLLSKTGPLLTTSANYPGEPEANTLQEAEAYFGDAVDFYVDGGDLSGRESSTVMRIVDDAVEVLRQGAVKISEAGEIVNDV